MELLQWVPGREENGGLHPKTCKTVEECENICGIWIVKMNLIYSLSGVLSIGLQSYVSFCLNVNLEVIGMKVR